METDKPSNGEAEDVKEKEVEKEKEKEAESEKKSPEGGEETKTEPSEAKPEEPEVKGKTLLSRFSSSVQFELRNFLRLLSKQTRLDFCHKRINT